MNEFFFFNSWVNQPTDQLEQNCRKNKKSIQFPGFGTDTITQN